MSVHRAKARQFAESFLVRSRLPSVARLLSANRPLIIAYHNVVSDPHRPYGDSTLHLSVEKFAKHVEVLRDLYDVVPLNDIRLPSSNGGKPRIAITFDDAYVGAVKNAIPLLADAGLPFTIFVAPGRLGGHVFWWDAAESYCMRGPSVEFRTHVLTTLAGRDESARASAPSFGFWLCGNVPQEARTASEDDLLQAVARTPLLTLGSHSWSHLSLSGISPDELRDELAQSLDWVRRFGDRGIAWLAYPYGMFSREVERYAEAIGYVGGVRIEGGTVRPGQAAEFSLPRTDIPARVSSNGFVLRLSGLVR